MSAASFIQSLYGSYLVDLLCISTFAFYPLEGRQYPASHRSSFQEMLPLAVVGTPLSPTLTWKSSKTPRVLCYTWNFWYAS